MKYKFAVGEKVLCFEPDESKARVLYNAKIMDADIVKDSKGKKKVEYKIHFQGWNHVWDRWADEAFVVRDDEENRKLQRKLARKAIKQLSLQKGKKRHHLPGVANKQADDEELIDERYSSDDSIESSSSSLQISDKKTDPDDYYIPAKKAHLGSTERQYVSLHNFEDDTNTVLRDELPSRRLVSLDIPAPLRVRLEEDFTMIKKHGMLVNLPVCPNIVQILDNYIKKFGQQYVTLLEKQKFGVSSSQRCEPDMLLPPGKRLNLCQEVCSDVKLLFDFALPLTLLYQPERLQFKQLMKNLKFCPEIDNNSDQRHYIKDTNTSEDVGRISPTKSISDSSNSSLSIKPGSESQQSNLQILTQKPHAKKKTAEDLLIEETHKYLIPNQPNLDQTGLSQDSQGRRRSSRLSHHEITPPKSSDQKLDADTQEIKQDAKIPSVNTTANAVSVNSYVFLRVPTKKNCPPVNHNGGQSPVAANSQQQLYNANPCMDWETYILSCGGDAKTINELKRIWNWSILPRSYEPEKGTMIPPSLVYGVHHLLRFFAKLPDIMVQMEIPEYKVRVIMKLLHGLLKFLGEYERELFEIDHYIPSDTISFDE